jgi:Fur family ferric uptake transcriptional regulator
MKTTTTSSSKSTGRANALTEQAWRKFVALIKQRGARVTRSRRIVFEHALARSDHFRADELADELSHGPRRVSRGTIYRTLALMEEAGFVRPIRDSDVHCHYERSYGHRHHEHMVCDKCGEFLEFRAPEITKAIREHCRKRRFEERQHRVVIFGTCKKCAAKKKREK